MDRNDIYNSRNFNPINYVISAVLIYLREMYKNNPNLGYVVCDEFDNDEPSQISGLLITDKNTWDTKFTGHLPSLVVRRGPVSFGGGIQGEGHGRVLNAGMDLATTTMEIVSIPVVISCIARGDIEAETLAYMTTTFLREDKRWAQHLELYGIASPFISPSMPRNPSETEFVCEVSTSISVTKLCVARLLPEVKLKEIKLRLNSSLVADIRSDT